MEKAEKIKQVKNEWMINFKYIRNRDWSYFCEAY